MARLLYRLGVGAHRRRVVVVLLWLLVLAGTAAGAATLAGETSNAFSIPGQESTTALDKIKEQFGTAGGATARVVVQAPRAARSSNPTRPRRSASWSRAWTPCRASPALPTRWTPPRRR
ncbi:hypothetical protein ACQPW3_12255 [Actinosynnema sp. CA-248983]